MASVVTNWSFITLLESPSNMGSKFIDYTGKVVQGRRPPQGPLVSGTEADMAKAIKDLSQRIVELESRTGRPSIEFECDLPVDGVVRLIHNFGGAVRWFVTSWKRNTNAAPWNLTELDALSTANTLALTSKADGFAVIRVESAEATVTAPRGDSTAIVAVGPPGADGAAGSLWTTAYEWDFTAMTLSTVTGNGAFTISGQTFANQTWDVSNYANSSVMSVGGSDGMRIKCGPHISGMAATYYLAPLFKSPSLYTLLVTSGLIADDCRIGIRLSTNVMSWTRNDSSIGGATEHDASAIMLDTGNTVVLGAPNSHRYEVGHRHSDTAQRDFGRILHRNNHRLDLRDGIRDPTHDCMQMEIPYLGHGELRHNGGIYSSGFPTKWYPIQSGWANSGVWVESLLTQLSDAYINVYQGACSTNGTSEGKFGRLRLEYALYTP